MMKEEVNIQREKIIYKVTWFGFFVNLFLAVAKLLAGFFGRSSAMIADGVHTLSDFATDLVVIVFVKISAKPKDEGHDYGHGKFETLGTIIIGMALLAVAVSIFINSVEMIGKVIKGFTIPRPGLVAVIAGLVSILAKEWLYRYTIRVARKTDSPVLKANAWHHRSDAFSSIGTLIGIGGAYLLGDKWCVLDPIAAVIVSLMIGKVAYDLVVPGLNELLDSSLPKEQEREILDLIMEDSLLSDPHNLKTRRIGSGISIEVHVRMDGQTTVSRSHDATVAIEKRLKRKYGPRTQVIIHIEPIK